MVHGWGALVLSISLMLATDVSFAQVPNQRTVETAGPRSLPCNGRVARVEVVDWRPLLRAGILPADGGLSGGKVALTFDDGPNPDFLPQILDTLKECGVRAHFFFVGRRVRIVSDAEAALPRSERLLARVVDEGHIVGSHSMTHSLDRRIGHLVQRGDAATLSVEVDAAHALIEDRFGVQTPFIRFPYGHGWRVPAAHSYLRARGLVHFFWNMSTGDSIRGQPPTEHSVLARTLSDVRRHGGGILLAHERGATSRALRRILMTMIDEGFTFVVYAP
jgi:peptidoglycan/xylan/chitin deacetylase (PgdA/CDA1 family)